MDFEEDSFLKVFLENASRFAIISVNRVPAIAQHIKGTTCGPKLQNSTDNTDLFNSSHDLLLNMMNGMLSIGNAFFLK